MEPQVPIRRALKTRFLLAFAGLLGACGDGVASGPWVALTGGQRTGEPHADAAGRVRFDAGGLLAWVDFGLTRSDWQPGDSPGRWSARRPDGPSFMKGSGEELTLGSEALVLRYQPEIDTPFDLEHLPPGSFTTIGHGIHVHLAPGQEPPQHLRFSVMKRRSPLERPALGDWTGDGFTLWSGETVSFPLPAAGDRTLRFYWCLEGIAGEASAPSRSRLRIALEDQTLFEQERESAGKRSGGWCAVELPDRVPGGASLRFELDGALAFAAVLAPVIGPRDGPAARAAPGAGARRPDLILFLADTFRADLLDYEGGDPSWTPRINALAAKSLRFTSARSPSTWTLPAQASMFTGLYPEQHGATSLGRALAGSVTTLAERLAAGGYRTGAITDSAFVSRNYGFDQGFAWFQEQRTWNLRETLRAAREFLEADDGRPVFLFVHTFRMHMPYRVGAEEDRGVLRELVAELRAGCAEYGGDGSIPRDQAARRLEQLYRSSALSLDEQFGAWWDALRSRAGAPPAFLVFTSDHGEAFFEHDDIGHGGTPWEEKTRIPLFVHGPGVASGTIEQAASLVDLPATFCALAGLAGDPTWEGEDLLTPRRPRTSYSFVRIGEHSMVALVEGTRKIYGEADERRLAAGEIRAAIDLARDPHERENLAASEAWPADLARARSAIIARLTLELAAPVPVDLSAEDRAFLDQIGYGGE